MRLNNKGYFLVQVIIVIDVWSSCNLLQCLRLYLLYILHKYQVGYNGGKKIISLVQEWADTVSYIQEVR